MASRKGTAKRADVDGIRRLLKAAGLRTTPARIAVMQELRAAKSPQTHADVAAKLVPLGFDKTTVFRNLTDLADAQLATRTELGDHVWRFEISDPNDPDADRHPHFLCVDCGSVTCLADINFTADSRKRATQIGRITEVLVKGYCNTCEAGRA